MCFQINWNKKFFSLSNNFFAKTFEKVAHFNYTLLWVNMATIRLGLKSPPRNTFVLKEVAFSFLERDTNLKQKHFMVKLEDDQVCLSNLPWKYKKINSFLENHRPYCPKPRRSKIMWSTGGNKKYSPCKCERQRKSSVV